jgi:predicted PurR-regulated permease PerM
MDFDSHVAARVLGVLGQLLLLEPGEIDDASHSSAAGLKRTADRERLVAHDPRHRDDHGRVVVRTDIETHTALASVYHVRPDLNDLSVNGRVDVGVGCRADIEPSVVGSGSARQLVVVDATAAKAGNAVEKPGEQSFVDLLAFGREGDGVRYGVIADRRHRGARNRKLQRKNAGTGDDYRHRLRAGERSFVGGWDGAQRRNRATVGPGAEDEDERDDRRSNSKSGLPGAMSRVARVTGRLVPPLRAPALPARVCTVRHEDHRTEEVSRFQITYGALHRRGHDTITVMPDGAIRIAIPRWIQLVGLPLLLLLAWTLASTLGRAVFLFIVAGLVALLLNPVVRALGRIWIPRGIAIAIVYLSFAAAATFCVIALATVGTDRVRSSSDRVNNYFTKDNSQHHTGAERDVDRLQIWLNTHHLERIKIRKHGLEFVSSINVKGVTSRAIHLIEGAALSAIEILFSIVLVVVVSIYMLLDMNRMSARIDRRFPPRRGSPPLLTQLEQALAGYVKGQLLLSLIIGFSAGAGLWLFGVTGLLHGADRYALYFGLWVAFTELIPYLGPWLGAIPPFFYALVLHPIAALWVALLFLGIQQIEGHIVVPKVMGSALRLHPLLVIFGMLAGAEMYGVLGVFVALPLLAVMRALWEFFADRIMFETWVPATATSIGVSATPAPPAQAKPKRAKPRRKKPPAAAKKKNDASPTEPDKQAGEK